MHIFNLEIYKPSEIELWVSEKYREYGIHYAADMDLDRIGSIFNAYISYTEGETKVMYGEDNDALIFLNIHLDIPDRRLAFFHELCHPAMHVGDQRNLPSAFVSLQESQAAQFQMCAAMPAYLLEEFNPYLYQSSYLRVLSEAFNLPLHFVKRRIEQIYGRIRQERSDRNTRARMAPSPVTYGYTDETIKILNQLNRQVTTKKGVRQVNDGLGSL